MRIPVRIEKIDEDRRIAFGWASVVESQNGVVIDSQDDLLDGVSLEKAVYEYVLLSRDADEMHEKRGVGRLVESAFFTPDKIEKMGLAPDALPTGWWVGFKVDDERVWQRVKDGVYKMFSIYGTGRREVMGGEPSDD